MTAIHLPPRRDDFDFVGDLVLHPISWAEEIAQAERYLGGRLQEAHPEDSRRVLAVVAPCIDLEHRLGVCPMGRCHDVRQVETHNDVMDGFFTAILQQYTAKGGASLAASYIAVGLSTQSNAPDMTQLGSEYYRAVPTDLQQSGTQAQAFFFLPQSVANAYLHEFAVFSGSATASANSGLMCNRWLYDFPKDFTMTLNGLHVLRRRP